jgi:glutathione synthase
MLRTKLSSADEGGVAAGAGALDSPYLIDWLCIYTSNVIK